VILIPAIDLKDGQCVRLKQGDMNQSTIYSEDPVAMARHWKQEGCRRLHVVDLDGAFSGQPENRVLIQNIVEAMQEIPVQVGAGIRTREHIETYVSMGISTLVLGTKALESKDFLIEMASSFPNQIVLGLDARQGRVATHGWASIEKELAVDVAFAVKDLPLAGIVYTDIERDGMMSGVNGKSTLEVAKKSGIPTIASGGIHELSDLEGLKNVFKDDYNLLLGVITGRAIYEGKLNFKEGQQLLDQ